MVKFNLKDFKRVGLDDKDVFNKFYQKYSIPHSDYSFVTMVCWQHYMKYFYKIINESLLLFTDCSGKRQFRPPIGTISTELDKEILRFGYEKCSEPPIGMVTELAKARLEEQFTNIKFKPDRDYFDYVYLSKDLKELSGKTFMKIRNQINRFNKRYYYEVESITEDNLLEVKRLLKRWCLWKDCDKIPLLASEKKAVLFCVNHFFELGVSGISIRIDDNLEAVSIFESINSDSAIIHFEKAIPDFHGLYQVINQEEAKILAKDHKFINRESDMGFAGLRLAKKKYHPHHMNEVFHINMDNLEKVL